MFNISIILYKLFPWLFVKEPMAYWEWWRHHGGEDRATVGEKAILGDGNFQKELKVLAAYASSKDDESLGDFMLVFGPKIQEVVHLSDENKKKHKKFARKVIAICDALDVYPCLIIW